MARGILFPGELLPIADSAIRAFARNSLKDLEDEIALADEGGVLDAADDAAACHAIAMSHVHAGRFEDADLASACSEYAQDDHDGNWAVLQILDSRWGRSQPSAQREEALRGRRDASIAALTGG